MKKPKNYYCHRSSETSSQFGENTNYEIIEKIGEGSFGEVFKVFDPSTSSLAVVKKIKGDQGLSQEARILSQLTNSDGFDKLKASDAFWQDNKQSQQSKQSIIMMGCLGPSTGTIMRKIKKMNIYSMKKVAAQSIKKLKQIHNKTYVHRDVKPDNILLGNKYDSHSIYLIDFGLTIPYRKNSVKARKIMDSLVGTAKYCPLASHEGIQQYPKDDLESLGYVLLFYVQGNLPWEKCDGKDEDEIFEKIHSIKKKCSLEDLCGGINCLRKYWALVSKLKIGENIDYSKLLQIFETGDPQHRNCFEFCTDCWIQKDRAWKGNDDAEIINQPRSNRIHALTLNYNA